LLYTSVHFTLFGLSLTIISPVFVATDGGRMAIALFGRVFKISVATLALIAILLLGSFGDSDLFLFYFMFVVFFQRGNEIPARNEIDKLGMYD
jgi:hypothetical protein